MCLRKLLAGSTQLISYYFVKDHRGSILQVVNVNTGEVKQSLKYSEFGEVLEDINPGFQPFGFAGGLYDHETGLVRFGARDYDGRIGGWLSKDPIRFNGGDSNLYGYVLNDPVNLIDPLGLWDGPATSPSDSGLPYAGSTYDKVKKISYEVLEQNPGTNDMGDAMRHAIWSRRMADETNAAVSLGVGAINEGLALVLRDGTLRESQMDMHNNFEGIMSSLQNRPINPNNLDVINSCPPKK